MKAYMHCITKHDIEHQFGCKKEMLKEFFDNAENNTEISVTGFISKIEMKVTILTATDTRLSNNIFSLFEKEGKCEIDDIVIFYKNGYRNYTVELVKKNDKKYSILKDLFLDPRHLSIYTNSESLKKALSLSASSKIPYPRNRIIFGAPGTGKSYKLNQECVEFFKDDIPLTEEQIIEKEIQDAGNNYASCFAIGLKHYEVLKEKGAKNIEKKYNCSHHAAYSVYQGSRVNEFYSSLPDYNIKENSYVQKIKDQIERVKNEKFLLQAGCAAIGLKYSDFFQDLSISDITDMFGFISTSSSATWFYRGVKAADYNFDKTSVQKSLKHYERVTFHPNYTYSQFVGTYKPAMKTVSDDDGEKEEITYSFVPGPFLRVYVNAVKNPGENYLLIIEEINRANVAAVFGDVFQLLDRKDSGESEYPVTAGEDIRKYLKSRGIDKTELSIPENMYIWATMNSADQGVFPMDTAFKRRWNFEYIGIDENEEGIKIYEIPTGRNKKVNWNSLRKAINRKLINAKINEDKLLGPYFISEKDLKSALQNPEDFIKLFKSKVLMYLFEDAAKMKSDFFSKRTYSEICKEFDKNGIALFSFTDAEKGEGSDKLEELEIEPKPAVPESASE